MKGKGIYLVLALAVAVSMALVIPVYASTSSVEVDNNTVESSSHTIDVTLDDGSALTMPLEIIIPDYDPSDTHDVTISGHKIKVTSNVGPTNVARIVHVRAYLELDTGSWLLIDSASLSVQGIAEPFDFGVDGTQTGVPTDEIELLLSAGSTEKSVSFTLTITFKSDVPQDLYDNIKSNFSGKLVFVMSETDPLTPDS